MGIFNRKVVGPAADKQGVAQGFLLKELIKTGLSDYMAQYSLVRGWIECAFEEVPLIEQIVSVHWEAAGEFQVDDRSAALYREGWVFPRKPLNWVSLIFYGGNIRSVAVPFLKACLSEISQSGLEINGVFYVDDEEGVDLQLWSLNEQGLIEAKRTGSSIRFKG